jgi:hypothetical protein
MTALRSGLVYRHPEREPGFLGVGRHLETPAMGLGYLVGDVEPKAKALHAGTNLAAVEWLEQSLHGGRGNRVTTVGDR